MEKKKFVDRVCVAGGINRGADCRTGGSSCWNWSETRHRNSGGNSSRKSVGFVCIFGGDPHSFGDENYQAASNVFSLTFGVIAGHGPMKVGLRLIFGRNHKLGWVAGVF